MNTFDLGRAWYAQVLDLQEEARARFQDGYYYRVVRLAQEAMEMAQKSLLMFCGFDAPRSHDLSGVVDRLDVVQQNLSVAQRRALRKASHNLARKRLVSMYGDETGIPAKFLFDERDAASALQDMGMVIKVVQSITGFGTVAEDHV